MSDGGITELNPNSLPAEGGRLFWFYIKGCFFIPPVSLPCICHQHFYAVCFHTFRGQPLGCPLFLVGATLLTSIVDNSATLRYLQRCDQKVPPHPHQKSLKEKC